MKTNILGVKVDTLTNSEVLKKIDLFLKEDGMKMIFTPNPEMIMAAREDSRFMEVLNNADIVIPDGIGVVYASKLNKEKISERVAGADTVFSMFEKYKSMGKTVYLLGAGKGVAEMAKSKMEVKYPGLKIVGVHDGYFDAEEEKNIIAEINTLKPDILLVGLGLGKQEKWIYDHKDLNVKLAMGVGGVIDVMAGVVNRAPDIFIKLNLEWLYRALKQPKRFFRLLKLPLFVLVVICGKLTKKQY